jgi:acyl-CoA thioester hydrolase
MPDAAQLGSLPELGRVRVPAEWLDMNGHVNVQHYLGMYNLTSDSMLELLGISGDWVRREQMGLVDLEHHIWFQRELHAGEEVALCIRFIGRDAKRVHGLMFMVNVADAEVASAIEFMSLAVNLETRRAAPLPATVAERVDALVRDHEALDWLAPRSGAIAL